MLKEHIGEALKHDGLGATLCGEVAPAGRWKAGAAYQGLAILGVKSNQFCAICQREWIRRKALEASGPAP